MRGGMQFNPANDRGFVTDKPFFGKNPTYGAAISYYLIGITGKIIEGGGAYLPGLDKNLLSLLSIPLIVAGVWYAVRRVRRRLLSVPKNS